VKQPTLGTDVDGNDVAMDVDRLVETRLLVNANSGGGKSWALRRILEQTHGRLQQLVIDPEGEFHTLREKFDYVLVARQGGDCLADPRSAGLLAKRLLELGTSAILDIYELHAQERKQFVRLFLESLINAARELWHPALVVIDEAHVYAPEVGDAESADAVKDLMTRGRKRGFAGLLATQRLSKLHKDAAAEANNVLIGRAAQDVDMKRAAYLLGFAGREEQAQLRTLPAGRFFAFGPAIAPGGVIELQVGPVSSTHPRAGQRSTAPAPARETVRRVLAQLADLPKEAAEEAKTMAELRRRNQELERELRGKPKPEAPAPPKIERVEVSILKDSHAKAIGEAAEQFSKAADRASTVSAEIVAELKRLRNGHSPPAALLDKPHVSSRPVVSRPPVKREAQPSGDPTGPEQRILDAIAWMESIGIDAPQQVAVAFLAGYTTGGGAWNNPRGSLRTQGYVEYLGGDGIRLTESGRALARYPDFPLTAKQLQLKVMDRLPGPECKLLEALIEAYPDGLTNEELAARTGYSVGGGAYNNPRGRLRSLGLIDYRGGQVRALPLLFLEGK